MRQIVPCNDPLKFASLKAEPDFRWVPFRFFGASGDQIVNLNEEANRPSIASNAVCSLSVLGKRLGKSMAVVAKAVKALSTADILNFEKEGSILIEGHLLSKSDIKVG